ncbi:MAG: rod shape-determining protein RodA [Leptospiraceae bacterium]|nr:rod shape-determining protein RodA [Leptospiraceae bacterium]
MGSVFIVVFAGIFTLYTQEVILEDESVWYRTFWIRQLIIFIIGLMIALVLRRINYQVLEAYAIPAYGIAIFLLLLTFIIGSRIKGAKSWIVIGPFGLQTSEFAKLATIILIAKYLELKERELDRIPTLLIPFGLAVVPMFLIVLQPDFGSAFSFAPVLMSMLFIAGADIFHISSVLIFFGVSLSIPLYLEYYKITLVAPLLNRLEDLEKMDLMPAVRILDTDVWNFIYDKKIPDHILENAAQGQGVTDLNYLQNILGNADLLQSFREVADTVRYESGGFLLSFLDNLTLLLVIGVVFALIAAVLFVLRYSQGTSLHKLRNFYIPLGVIGVSLITAVTFQKTVSFKHHQVVRITAFINPEKFPRDRAYHIRASKAAIGSGELTGRGMFQGDMTIGRTPLVPEANTDFIFTAWSERTGFVGSVLLLLVLLAIPLRGLLIAFESRDRFGSLLASGISFLFFYHIALNAGIAMGLLPVTGLPLSFMSYGGSHLLMCMLGVGILLSVHRRKYVN